LIYNRHVYLILAAAPDRIRTGMAPAQWRARRAQARAQGRAPGRWGDALKSLAGIVVGIALMTLVFYTLLNYDPLSRYQAAFAEHRLNKESKRVGAALAGAIGQ